MPDLPDLAALVADPARVADVPLEALPTLLAQVAAVQVAALARLLTTEATPSATASEERLLDVREAAALLGVAPGWLRRRPTLPFVVKLSDGVVRYSRRGLERFIRHNTVKS